LPQELLEAIRSFEASKVTPSILEELAYVFHGLSVRVASTSVEQACLNGEVCFGRDLFPESIVDSGAKRSLLLGYAAMALRVNRRLKRKDLPLCRQAGVKEKSSKVRGVTPLDSSVTYMASILNSLLLSLLDQDLRVNAKSATPADDAAAVLWTQEGDILRSVDMSRATDLIPHNLALALVTGLCRDSISQSFFHGLSG